MRLWRTGLTTLVAVGLVFAGASAAFAGHPPARAQATVSFGQSALKLHCQNGKPSSMIFRFVYDASALQKSYRVTAEIRMTGPQGSITFRTRPKTITARSTGVKRMPLHDFELADNGWSYAIYVHPSNTPRSDPARLITRSGTVTCHHPRGATLVGPHVSVSTVCQGRATVTVDNGEGSTTWEPTVYKRNGHVVHGPAVAKGQSATMTIRRPGPKTVGIRVRSAHGGLWLGTLPLIRTC
ncbi:MAG: hypothetical protein INR66_20560 [Gordonia polyisoprenivorans]|nr:hypothetical protein [Gordonia polyisoprenivorans]